MTKIQHTPGPWGTFWNEENARLGIGGWYFTHSDNGRLPLLRCKRDNRHAEANARLIAAAPDMLDALKALKNNLSFGAWAKVEAAINKAEGAHQ